MKSETTRYCLIVAGMHRSGTSAVTRVINLLGADISKNLMPAVQGNNDRGFWEPTNVVSIHDQLLADLGGAWDDPLSLPEDWPTSDAARRSRQLLTAELNSDFCGSNAFVLKDPRLPRFLPLWLDLLDEAEVEPIIIITVRNPLEVAASLKKRDGFSLSKSLLLYVRSNLDAEWFSRGRHRYFVSYEDLLEDWRPFADTIIKAIGTKASQDIDNRICEYLSRELRHNQSSRGELLNHKNVPSLVVELYDCLVQATIGNATDLFDRFDDLRASFSQGLSLFGDLIRTERRAARSELARSLDQLTDVVASQERLVVAHQAKINALSMDLEIARLHNELLEADNKRALARTEALTAENEASSVTIAKIELRSDKIQSMLAQKDAEIEALQRAVEDRTRRIHDLKTR